MNVKHIDHLNLNVTDLAETVRWYGEVFGFEPTESGMYEGRPWTIVRAGEALLCLYQAGGALAPGERLNHYALRVSDGDAIAARLDALGVPVLYDGVVRWPRSRSWYVVDPSGYEIEIVAWNGDRVSFDAHSIEP